MTDHPSREMLNAFVRGELSEEETRAIIPHVTQDCVECSGVLEMIWQDLRLRRGRPSLTPEEDVAYDAAIGRAIRGARKRHRELQREQREAAKAAGILSGEGFKPGRKLTRKLNDVARLEVLLAQSWSLRHESPSEMVQFAMMAVQLAKTLNAKRHGAARVLDLQARSYGELGNAYRVLSQYDLAGENLSRARDLLALGSGDESLEIRLLELEASLAADRHRFDIAAHNLLKVIDFYLRLGDRHLAGRATISRGLFIGYWGEPEQAISILQQGLSLIDADREPRLVYSVVHNQLLFLAESGRFREAKIFRLRHSHILSRNEGKVIAAGLRSIDAMIEFGLGNLESAEIAFRETKQQYEELNRPHPASVAALNLAAVLLAQHQPGEAYEVALAASKVFQALRIGREAIAALVVLQTAFQVGRANEKLVKDIADFFRKLERDPNAKLEIDPE